MADSPEGPRCPGCGVLVDGEPRRCPQCGLDFEYYADLREVCERLEPPAEGAPRPPLPRKVDDLEQLDRLHVSAWHASRGAQFYTRVRSGGRVHVWPGDPDDVVAWLLHGGFAFRLVTGSGSTPETIVDVVGGPGGALS